MVIQQFDTVIATYSPRNRQNIKPEANKWIGQRMRWFAGWIIEKEDFPEYAGQLAMIPRDKIPDGLEPLGWVPDRDLIKIEPV